MLKAAYIPSLSKDLKILIGLFLIVLSIGFYLGLGFVNHTTENNPKGIIENYNGNDMDENADIMKFRKSKHEIYNILHTHFLSLSSIFFILGLLTFGVPMKPSLRKFLMIEPTLSVLMTFGGIYFLWIGIEWMVYLVIFSGVLMTASYTLAVTLILIALIKGKQKLPKSG